jgi:hypothetical protein
VPLELLVELEIVVTGVQIEHVLVELNVVLEIEDKQASKTGCTRRVRNERAAIPRGCSTCGGRPASAAASLDRVLYGKKLSKHLSSSRSQKLNQNQNLQRTQMRICEHFLMLRENAAIFMIEQLDSQQINDRVQELLYSLDEIPNEMAGAAVCPLAWPRALDAQARAAISLKPANPIFEALDTPAYLVENCDEASFSKRVDWMWECRHEPGSYARSNRLQTRQGVRLEK